MIRLREGYELIRLRASSAPGPLRASSAPGPIPASINFRNVVKFDKDDKYANSVAIFRKKQEQILSNALRKADNLYKLIKENEKNGITLNDCIDAVKREFDNDELLINLVMDNINADLVTLAEKEQIIVEQNAQIESLKAENEASKELEQTEQIESYKEEIKCYEELIKGYKEEIKGYDEMAKKLIQELKAKDDEIAELKKELE